MASSDLEEFVCESYDGVDLELVPGLGLNRKRSSDSLASQGSVWLIEDEEVIRSVPLNTDGTTPEGILHISSSLGKRRADTQEEVIHRSPKKSRAESSEGSTSTFSQSSSSTGSSITLASIDDENPYLISPQHHQTFLKNKALPYGILFEIARLNSIGELDYDAVKISNLATKLANRTNADAILELPAILGHRDTGFSNTIPGPGGKIFAKEAAARSPWGELDNEEKALKERPTDGCLGLSPDREWYGGKVQFRGTLKFEKAKPCKSAGKKPADIQYMIELERVEIGSSTRFTRRFGSQNFFRVKVSKEVQRDVEFDSLINTFFRRPVIIWGNVFRVFYAKETTAFYFRTNEVYEKGPTISTKPSTKGVPAEGVPRGLSIVEFLDWHNPIGCNKNQSLAKYTSRFHLGLSNSAPGILLDPSQVVDVEDFVSPSGSDMTDGAGLINDAALLRLHHLFHWQNFPTAVQVRFAGSKGLLVRHPSDYENEPRIYIRNSLKKIQYPDTTTIDPAKSSIDLLRASHIHPGCRLSAETIINLAENGVPKSAFIDLVKRNGEILAKSFTDWDSPNAMIQLHRVVGREGGVMAARRAREDLSSARVLGYSNKSIEEESDDEDEDRPEAHSSAWWADETSGSPSSLEETVLKLLESGFHPKLCQILAAKLHQTMKTALQSKICNLHIELEMAATAFLVPDELDVLEPGEIFFKSSNRNLMMPNGIKSDVVLGDVLIGRNPTKLPGDVQKWKAVFRPELAYLTDVIVLSRKGDRRAADFLAGGDYDGDKAYLIWHPSLVQPFTNAPSDLSLEPPNMKANFAKETETVSTFLETTKECTEVERYRCLQKHLLGALRDRALVGMYSNYHDCAVYKLGYTHPETIRLAHMFCLVLDASKSGLTVLPDVLSKDSKFNGALQWKENLKKKKKKKTDGTVDANANVIYLMRPNGLHSFIMDDLCSAAKAEYDTIYAQVEKQFKDVEESKMIDDEQLKGPWLEQLKLCNKFPHLKKDLDEIEAHVKKMRKKWEARVKAQGQRFTDLSIELRQDVLRELSQEFHSYPKVGEVQLCEVSIQLARASFAYIHDKDMRSAGWSRFPWDVAFRNLCEIKARATKTHTVLIDSFHTHAYFK